MVKSLHPFPLSLSVSCLASFAKKAMEFHSPHHTPPPRTGDVSWLPGSSARDFSRSRESRDMLQVFPCSPNRESFDLVHMDRMRCKQELQKLYEDALESSYDLSLKDIVDPCYSISGNLKAMVAEAELKANDSQDARRSCCSRKGSSIPKLTFSFSFPGLRGKSRRTRPNLYAARTSSAQDGKDAEASTSQRSSSVKVSPSKFRNSPEIGALSTARIHPSNQCSMCSSYTIFFKSRCLVCGRLYCSNCAREHMDKLSEGYKCKVSCKSASLSKRLSGKIGSRCWPFGIGTDVRKLNSYY